MAPRENELQLPYKVNVDRKSISDEDVVKMLKQQTGNYGTKDEKKKQLTNLIGGVDALKSACPAVLKPAL